MMERRASIRIAFAATGTLALCLLLLGGCAPIEPARGATAERDATGGIQSGEAARDTARASYDIEDEMPEKSPQRPAQLVETLEPVRSDTISVQDVAVEEAPKQRYDVGYRIQVFASGDRAAAEKVKEKIAAETAMNAYIEFEDGLYKVRAGDFAERKDAAQARLKLAGTYPGSWIVRTTIRR